MLLYTILLLFFLQQLAFCVDLTYIMKTESGELKPSCAAEGNVRQYGIGWIYPVPENPENLPNITSRFVPEIKNGFNCNFSSSSLCSKVWSLRNWKTNDNSTQDFDFIADTRWESLPLIHTSAKSKDFEEKIEVPNVFKIGFSIRATHSVELYVCEGWNPHNYPSYYFNVTKRTIEFKKFAALPKSEEGKTDQPVIDNYMAYSNIISADEWRNFELSFTENGTLTLVDVNFNRTVVLFGEKNALKPMYLILKSTKPSLWKIHKNEFLYTKSAQVSRFGPILHLTQRNLCISLYVSMCETCTMNFFRMDGNQRKTLKFVESEKNNGWREIKIKEENVEEEKINIFLETKIESKNANETGFWAVDEVRVCHENEIKVTYLHFQNSTNLSSDETDSVSCQIVQNPKWRPKKLVFNDVTDFPAINFTSIANSIKMVWPEKASSNVQKNLFFITYQANDICESEPFNMKRIKSNGFLITEHNQLVMEQLVPFTLYNISFSSLIHENPQLFRIETRETELPTPEELPNKVKIQVTDTAAYVSWEKIDCTKLYGNLIHALEVKSLSTNFSTEIKGTNDYTHVFEGLEPFTKYTVTIYTARSRDYIEKKVKTLRMSIDFTTKPGVAPAVSNLEIFSRDENMVSFRYDLPRHSRGSAAELQVMKCTPLYMRKCKSKVQPISHCKLWPSKYCGHVVDLIPNLQYQFKISIKNNLTHAFGNESVVEVFTMTQVPAAPNYLNYEAVDCAETYCHLNISWTHPYLPNASITSFNIILNDTESNNGTEETKSIHEVYKIANYTMYLPRYTHQIKYVPYSKQYKLYMYSSNSRYKSDVVSMNVKTPHVGQHLNMHPKLLEKTDTTLNFELPVLDKRLESYNLIVVVQDFDRNSTIGDGIKKDKHIYSNLCHNFGNTWISHNIKVSETKEHETITIGNDVIANEISNFQLSNKPLKPKTQYCLTFLVTNKYKNLNHDVIYYEKLLTEPEEVQKSSPEESSQFNYLWLLLLLFLLIPIAYVIFRFIFKKRRPKRKNQNTKENVYESMPFDDCEDHCVNNENYDSLLHK